MNRLLGSYRLSERDKHYLERMQGLPTYLTQLPLLFRVASIVKPATVLEIGCGRTLRLTNAIRVIQSLGQVIGVDLSGDVLSDAQQIAAREIDLVRADGLRLPFRHEVFHFVICSEMIEYVNPSLLLAECERTLAADGILFLTLRNAFGIHKLVLSLYYLLHRGLERLKMLHGAVLQLDERRNYQSLARLTNLLSHHGLELDEYITETGLLALLDNLGSKTGMRLRIGYLRVLFSVDLLLGRIIPSNFASGWDALIRKSMHGSDVSHSSQVI